MNKFKINVGKKIQMLLNSCIVNERITTLTPNILLNVYIYIYNVKWQHFSNNQLF